MHSPAADTDLSKPKMLTVLNKRNPGLKCKQVVGKYNKKGVIETTEMAGDLHNKSAEYKRIKNRDELVLVIKEIFS